jgi:hypothetical protein
MTDLDKSGYGFQRVRTYLGPSLGWVDELVQPSTHITTGGIHVVLPGESMLLVDVAATVTIQLPDVVKWMQQTAYQPATGFERSISVKDIGGNAANFNIVVAPFGQQTIDNVQASIVMSTARANVRLVPLIDLTGWAVETNSGGGGGGGGGDVFKAGNNTFTGVNTFQNTITAPTMVLSDDSINVATTAFVKGQNYITGAALTPYALIASPTFTGDPKAPTPSPGDNDTSIATTAFVQAALAGFTGGAPVNAEYIVGSLNGTLTNERVLTDTATVTWDLSTAGQAKANAVSGSAVAKVGFSAHKNGANQSIPAATQTKVTFGTEIYDIGSFYDPALARWTPPAGLVHIDAGLMIAGAATGFVSICSVYKNGAILKSGNLAPAPDGSVGTQVSIDDEANGTDFYEVFASVPPTSTATITGAAQATFFMGHLLGGPQGPPGPSGGVPEAPSDGSIYGRQNAAWAKSQPLDGDLTALSALAGTNTIYYRSATDTWSPVTFSGLSFSGGILTVTAGGGNVNSSGTPTNLQLAQWTDATHIQGIDISSLGFAPLASPTFTGDPKAPTPAPGDNDTSIATTAFVAAAVSAGSAGDVPSAGQLTFASATVLKFAPFKGNKIKINGSIYTIPNGGIAGLGNTSVFVNGVAGQNLVANTTYLIFAFINSGTVTADFRTAATHATSTTSGNEGVEILTGNDTRTLIGICRTLAGSPQFADSPLQRLVRSWFNDNTAQLLAPQTAPTSTGATSYAILGPTVEWVNFANEVVQLHYNAGSFSNSIATTVLTSIGLDGGLTGIDGAFSYRATYADTNSQESVVNATFQPSEGYHWAYPMGMVVTGGATVTWWVYTNSAGFRPALQGTVMR